MSHFSIFFRASVLSALLATPSFAQEVTPVSTEPMPEISRTILQEFYVTATGLESVFVLADIAPNVVIDNHTHPGNVTAYVVYGSIEVQIGTMTPTRYVAGQSFMVPANTVHNERTSTTGAKIVANFVVPVGEPLTIPAQ